jgi:hypothetical protein
MNEDHFLATLFDFVDVLMHTNNIEILDAICSSWQFDQTEDHSINCCRVMGLFVATLPVKSKLPSRSLLFDLAQVHFCNLNENDLWKGLK